MLYIIWKSGCKCVCSHTRCHWRAKGETYGILSHCCSVFIFLSDTMPQNFLFIYLFIFDPRFDTIFFFFSNYHDHPKKDNVCLTINMIKVLRRNITSEITVDVNIEVLYSITGHDFMNVRWRSVFGGGSRRVLLTEAPTLPSSFPRSSGSGMQWSLK